MPARKSRKSRSVRIKHTRIASRRQDIRPTRPLMIILCDDSKTAPSYFRLVAQQEKQHVTIRVARNSCDQSSPNAVIDRAIEEQRKLCESQNEGEESRDTVWALIDLEGGHIYSKLTSPTEKAQQNDISIVLSQPCYELWTLLHLEDTGEHFQHCAAVLDRLRQRWKTKFGQQLGPKAQADYSKILGNRPQAASRAKMHHDNNPRDPSWTQVFRIIEYIEKLKKMSADAAR